MKTIRRKYWALIALAVLLISGLFLPVQKYIVDYTDDVVRSTLARVVEENTDGKYKLDYEELKVNVFTQKIKLINFEILPTDSNAFLDTSQKKMTYSVDIDLVEMKLEKEWELFFNKKLVIDKMTISNPNIKVEDNNEDKQNFEIAKISGDLYKKVTSYLHLLQLKNFEVNGAKLKYKFSRKKLKQELNLNPFSFKLNNFRLDNKDQRKDRIFFTDDFELNSGSQSFILPDSSHTISFDRFRITTLSNDLEFYNLRVTPLNPDTLHQNSYLVFVPALKLKGVDFEGAYFNNQYLTKLLVMSKPVIKLTIPKHNTRKEALPDSIRVGKYMTSLLLNKINVSNGVLAITDKRGRNPKTYLARGFSAQIHRVQLDSNSFERVDLTKVQKNFRFSIKELKHEVAQENLLVKIKDIDYSSITKSLDCKRVVIRPNQFAKKQRLEEGGQPVHLESFDLSGVQVTSLNLNQLFSRKKTNIRNVTLIEPNISLSFDTTYMNIPDSNKRENQLTILHDLDSIFVDKFRIKKGSIQLYNLDDKKQNFIDIKEVDLWVKQLSLANISSDSTVIDRLLNTTSLKSGAAYFDHPLHNGSLQWKRLSYNSENKTINGIGLKCNANGKSKLDFLLSRFELSQIDTKPLIRGNRLKAKKLMVNDLTFNYDQKRIRTNGLKPLNLDLDLVDIHDVTLNLTRNDSTILKVNQFDFDASELRFETIDSLGRNRLSYDRIGVAYETAEALINRSKSVLRTSYGQFDSEDSTLQINEIRVSPIIRQKKIGQEAIVVQTIKNVTIVGFCPNASDVGKKMTAKNINVCTPETYVSGYKGKRKKKKEWTKEDLIQIQKWLSKHVGIDQIAYKGLNIENGNLNWILYDSTDQNLRFDDLPSYQLRIGQYDLQSKDFDLKANRVNNDDSLFYAIDHQLTLYNLTQTFPDSMNKIHVDKLKYSTKDKNIRIHNVSGSYMMKNKGKNKMYVEGNIPMVEFDGIRPIQFYKKGRADLKGIYLNKPRLEFTQMHKKSDVISRELSLSGTINSDSAAITSLLLKSLRINDGFVKWDFNDSNSKPLVIKHLNFDAEELVYPNPVPDQRIPKVGEIAFSFGDFEYDVLKKFYRMSFDSVNYDSRQQVMYLEAFKLDPVYGIFEFGQKAGWQKSRIELYLSSLNLKGFDAKKVLYENKLKVSWMDIDSLWVRNFKDKRLPERNRFKPMPLTRLNSLPLEVDLDSFELRKGNITHIQIAKNGVVPGKLYFTDLSARLTNLSNSKDNKNETTQLWANGKLMGEGQIATHFKFQRDHPNSQFNGHAQLGAFNATKLNQYLEHTAFIRVKKGVIKSGNTNFTGYKDFGHGDMKLLYNNLHVSFLNKKDTIHRGMGMVLKGFIANRIVYTKNPHIFTKKGVVYAERDSTKEIFNYWSKLGMSGVSSSMGIQNNKKAIKRIRREALRREKAIRRKEDEENE